MDRRSLVRRDRSGFRDLPPTPPQPQAFSREHPDLEDGEDISTIGGMEVLGSAMGPLSISTDSHSDAGMMRTMEIVYEEITNKQVPPAQSLAVLRKLERQENPNFQATFRGGACITTPGDDIDPRYPTLSVAFTFMAGADLPQINRVEQVGMEQKAPDQKTPQWRVNTAGSLLSNFDIDMNLAVLQNDNTPEIAKRARRRLSLSRTINPFDVSPGSLIPLTGSGKGRSAAVTIDSEQVRIVNDLDRDEWDIAATLIEVDAQSLLKLLCNYRHLIISGGRDRSLENTRGLLDTMQEDVRRLVLRSPVLFRMGTRRHIVRSKATRYGFDDGFQFRTFSTSQGIREIISTSASYYNSLSVYEHKNDVKASMRSKFLQMIVLLIAFLNDDDLKEISNFLESTYHFQTDRESIEMLILKVLPLGSINSKVFINSLRQATLSGWGPIPPDRDDWEGHKETWEQALHYWQTKGYWLPGAVVKKELGKEPNSWIVQWPERVGFDSSAVFNRLQHMDKNNVMNEIPPFNLYHHLVEKELTVDLVSGDKVTIDSRDVQGITSLIAGQYITTEAKQNGRGLDLEINETVVNDPLYQAARSINSITRLLKSYASDLTRRKSLTFRRIKKDEDAFRREVQCSGRLTCSTASFQGKHLATAYKNEGRKITRNDLVRTFHHDTQQIRSAVHSLGERLDQIRTLHVFTSVEYQDRYRELREMHNSAAADLSTAERNCQEIMNHNPRLRDDPIMKVYYSADDDVINTPEEWFDYRAWWTSNQTQLTNRAARPIHGYLYVESEHLIVKGVEWVSDAQLRVQFNDENLSIHCTPLYPVKESMRADEIAKGDAVLLMGNYVAVLMPWDQVKSGAVLFNTLRITGVTKQYATNRPVAKTISPTRQRVHVR
ncbi:MAG: hypothetical protein M1814_001763 [Vezdaea aestivalis]|nr:MAG: hypothetical protein M1814_001763 [Vezdaea aestivalis]